MKNAPIIWEALGTSWVPSGFLYDVYVDPTHFDRQHYRFDYVRREFLGEVRCVVFDVTPLPKSGKGRFKGRIGAEDRDFNIVRFNGIHVSQSGLTSFDIHFDSWRLNVQPGLWLPAVVFSGEADYKTFLERVRCRAQTRIWGYDLKNAHSDQEFTNIRVESFQGIEQSGTDRRDISPVQAERDWQREAEANVVDRLERVGLLAPVGEVDRVMETVINNPEVTNK